MWHVPIVPEDEELLCWRMWDMSWIMEIGLLGFNAVQMSPGCPLTLTWPQGFPQTPGFVLVP